MSKKRMIILLSVLAIALAAIVLAKAFAAPTIESGCGPNVCSISPISPVFG